MIRRNKRTLNIPTEKDTLFIIGNGFDMWQGLGTSYWKYKEFYLAHRDEILKKLRIKKQSVTFDDGQKIEFSDAEIIYGNPFYPGELEDKFWGEFESSLAEIDTFNLNSFFGKEKEDLIEMNESIRNAKRIFREAFCRWISEIVIDSKETDYHFGDNCLFVNFNYTDTLLKRFGINKLNEYHIHGEATNKKSIIFGHSSHPQTPEKALYDFEGRFRGLYFVDKILYETDKHVKENLYSLITFLSLRGMVSHNIKNVYILGHSMSISDMEYFYFLSQSTQVLKSKLPAAAEYNDDCEEIDPWDDLHLRIDYIINRIGYGLDDEMIDQDQKAAIKRKCDAEQAAMDEVYEKYIMKRFKKRIKHKKFNRLQEADPPIRTEDAVWYITYHTEKDRLWIEHIMNELEYKNYILYPSIDECLKPFLNKSTSI